MGEKLVIKDMVRDYLNALSIGSVFSMRDICSEIYLNTMGKRNPLDGTVGRLVREIRIEPDLPYDIICTDRPKALYKKIDKALVKN